MNIYDDLGHEIAKVAYELFEKSGRIHGRDLENWLEAERIVMAKYKEAGTSAFASSSSPSTESAVVKEKKTAKVGAKKETVKKTAVKPSAKTTRKKKE